MIHVVTIIDRFDEWFNHTHLIKSNKEEFNKLDNLTGEIAYLGSR